MLFFFNIILNGKSLGKTKTKIKPLKSVYLKKKKQEQKKTSTTFSLLYFFKEFIYNFLNIYESGHGDFEILYFFKQI